MKTDEEIPFFKRICLCAKNNDALKSLPFRKGIVRFSAPLLRWKSSFILQNAVGAGNDSFVLEDENNSDYFMSFVQLYGTNIHRVNLEIIYFNILSLRNIKPLEINIEFQFRLF